MRLVDVFWIGLKADDLSLPRRIEVNEVGRASGIFLEYTLKNDLHHEAPPLESSGSACGDLLHKKMAALCLRSLRVFVTGHATV